MKSCSLSEANRRTLRWYCPSTYKISGGALKLAKDREKKMLIEEDSSLKIENIPHSHLIALVLNRYFWLPIYLKYVFYATKNIEDIGEKTNQLIVLYLKKSLEYWNNLYLHSSHFHNFLSSYSTQNQSQVIILLYYIHT